jgi:hypothetical protein
MIAHIWRGRTRAGDLTDFTSLLEARVQAQLAASNACRGAYVLQRPIENSQVESLVLTLYDPRAPAPAVVSDTEARFLLGSDPVSARYDVVIDPRRAQLYAELRRRFPLRFAALR